MALFKARMPADSAPPIAQGKGWANLLKGSALVLKKEGESRHVIGKKDF